MAGTPGEGPYLLLWFEVSEGVIVRASYQTYGCPSAIASGSIAAQVLVGRRIEQAALLTAEDILLLLGGLPAGKEHCAKLVVTALANAFCG
jgi:nitrogen fixation NifU-like protein